MQHYLTYELNSANFYRAPIARANYLDVRGNTKVTYFNKYQSS